MGRVSRGESLRELQDRFLYSLVELLGRIDISRHMHREKNTVLVRRITKIRWPPGQVRSSECLFSRSFVAQQTAR